MASRLGEIAGLIKAELKGDPERQISGVATLKNAHPDQLSFLANRRYLPYLKTTRAAAVVISADYAADCPVDVLIVPDPHSAFVRAVRMLNPEPPLIPGIDPSARIHASARIAGSARIDAQVSIGADVVIKDNVYIGPGCIVQDQVVVGRDSRLVAGVILCQGVRIGERVLLHPGVVIGADGFGLAREGGIWVKVPQLGSVEIGDDVEIGANTTIDRGALDNTIIENGVKIDNQVQIGHNCIIGAHTAIAGCAAVAGSVTIGRHCMIGGATAIAGHIEIADNVIITGLSGVTNSILQAGTYSGAMTITDNRTWRKNMARFRRLDELARRVAALEEKNSKD